MDTVVEQMDLVIDKTARVPPDYEDDQTGKNDPEVSDMIDLSGMRRPNRDLNVTTEL